MTIGVKLVDLTNVQSTSVENSDVKFKTQIALFWVPKSRIVKFNSVVLGKYDSTTLEVILTFSAQCIDLSCWTEHWDPYTDALPRWVESLWPEVAVFDMDSTLIKEETIDELAATTGCQQEVENSRSKL